jgi:superfamily II DNA/RNA helicase
MPQPKRTETLERFRKGEIRLLVASDVAARGLDIQGLSHVFCFDVPIHAEDYIHRIGRTARAGRLGRSFMLAAPEDGRAVAAIVKLIGKEIPPVVIPGIEDAELEYDERQRRAPRRAARPDKRQPAHARDVAARSAPADAHRPRRDRRPSPTSAPPPDMARSNVTPFPSAAEVHRAGRQEREGPKVVGFGDHLPAFLSRPPRIIARP